MAYRVVSAADRRLRDCAEPRSNRSLPQQHLALRIDSNYQFADVGKRWVCQISVLNFL